MFPSRFVNLTDARARFGDRVDRLGPFLSSCDPAADAVVEVLHARKADGWAMFQRAVERGIGSISSPPEAFRAFFDEVDRVPAWVDWPTVDAGGEILWRSGVLSGLVLGTMSLPLGYASPGGNKPLVFSGRLRERAARRLSETSRFVQAVCKPGGMRRFGDGFQITLQVRIMHAQVRFLLQRSERWNSAAWGAPVNQHDMAATTLLFSIVLLEGLRKLGVEPKGDEAERYMHLWRYVGRVMGVCDELLPASALDANNLGQLIAATQGPPDDDSRALVTALVDSPLQAARTPKQRRFAVVRSQLARGFVRALVGEPLADALGVGPTPWQSAIGVFRSAGRIGDVAAGLFPSVRQRAIRSGARYWDRVVQLGLVEGPYEFRPAEALARQA